jgi:CheY-like chemotaxis protein
MSRPRLLLIDDDKRLTEVLEMAFEDDGSYELLIENDSTAAIQTAKDFRPDVILLDIVMPEMDGGDVSAMLQDEPELKETPVIIVSALVRKEDAGSEGSVELRGRSMLPKPYHFDRLKEIIDLKLAEVKASKEDTDRAG